jgi:hypothetical protein
MKIFGIGLSKTGTTSLAKALRCLGYRVSHYPVAMVKHDGQEPSIDPTFISRFDALIDTPVSTLYKKLDILYPHSKFILTIRDSESWLRSCRKHFEKPAAYGKTRPDWWNVKEQGVWSDNSSDMVNSWRLNTYNTITFDEERFREAYDRHVTGVINNFKKRTNDLLIINICNGEGWETLCSFLDKPHPNKPFPFVNATKP